MNAQQIQILAAIHASIARIEAMKAKNVEREQAGMSLAYDEQSFWVESQHLSDLSIQAANSGA